MESKEPNLGQMKSKEPILGQRLHSDFLKPEMGSSLSPQSWSQSQPNLQVIYKDDIIDDNSEKYLIIDNIYNFYEDLHKKAHTKLFDDFNNLTKFKQNFRRVFLQIDLDNLKYLDKERRFFFNLQAQKNNKYTKNSVEIDELQKLFYFAIMYDDQHYEYNDETTIKLINDYINKNLHYVTTKAGYKKSKKGKKGKKSKKSKKSKK
jgi:hypothetical protein